jgi:hypothetical protein
MKPTTTIAKTCTYCAKTPDCAKLHKTPNRCFIPTSRSGFSIAELALAHPQSLHDALTSLPFATFTLQELLRP